MNRTNEIIQDGIDSMLLQVRTLIRTHPELREEYASLTEQDLRHIAKAILQQRIEHAIQIGFKPELRFN